MKKDKNTKDKKLNDKKTKFLYFGLIILIIICVVLVINLIKKNNEALTPDYAPGTIDTNAIKEDDSKDKMDVADGGGAVSLAYSNVALVNSKNETIKMYFKNPGRSRESIVLELIIEQNGKEYVLAKSDLIPPGYAIYELDLLDTVKLPVGGYKGKFRLTYYDEETDAKQMVNIVRGKQINIMKEPVLLVILSLAVLLGQMYEFVILHKENDKERTYCKEILGYGYWAINASLFLEDFSYYLFVGLLCRSMKYSRIILLIFFIYELLIIYLNTKKRRIIYERN